MKIKTLALAAGLALSALSAQAVNVDQSISLVGSAADGFSAGLSDPSGTQVNHTLSGSFSDTFTFAFSGPAIIDVWLNTSASKGQLASQQIVFTSATLNGMALDIDPAWVAGGTVFRTAGLFQAPAEGNFVLTVNGYAGLEGSVGSVISASYSGGINVMPSAVPEPGSYALLLAGLGVVGFVARRRAR